MCNPIDYSKLDSFLRVATWHTSHPLDDERFHKALNEIVRQPGFSPDSMGNYMRVFLGSKAARYENEIEKRVSQADKIYGFLFDIGECQAH